MQASPYSSRKQDDSEFNNTNPRRYSASYIRNIREDITTTTTTRSFRSNTTISSTASSPGYSFKDEIDPSIYSFNTALKALQTRYCRSSWECLSPDGFALNSKWSEAEKYICNPISGEVPMECLSAKSLSGRSFRKPSSTINTTIRVVSDPLVYSSRQIQTKPSIYSNIQEEEDDDDVALQFPNPEIKKEEMTIEADGTQNTTPYLSTSSGNSALTSCIPERSTKPYYEDSPNSIAINKSKEEVEMQGKETWEAIKESERRKNEYMKRDVQLCRRSGCFSWMKHNKRHRENNERRRKNTTSFIHFKGC
ncbi:uncharacterized protein LOC130955182 isoform X1 [Arachis stenosperma]|uniref:uncharacterized protein LOC130955182 isoform X1 n=1 Tax=Arachis stenosperma TaxID=217475 RepID=UPI0025ACDACA|nr:uncharacterized protein LOC130955182 isoform X1 [Arachis stenosperma]